MLSFSPNASFSQASPSVPAFREWLLCFSAPDYMRLSIHHGKSCARNTQKERKRKELSAFFDVANSYPVHIVCCSTKCPGLTLLLVWTGLQSGEAVLIKPGVGSGQAGVCRLNNAGDLLQYILAVRNRLYAIPELFLSWVNPEVQLPVQHPGHYYLEPFTAADRSTTS